MQLRLWEKDEILVPSIHFSWNISTFSKGLFNTFVSFLTKNYHRHCGYINIGLIVGSGLSFFVKKKVLIIMHQRSNLRI